MNEIVFNNASRKIVSIFLLLTLAFAAAAIVPQIVLHGRIDRGSATEELREACNLSSVIALPLGIATLLSAILTLPTARQAERSFKAFREGDLLAQWEYDSGVWSRHMDCERDRARKVARWIYFLLFAPSTAMTLYITWQVQNTAHGKEAKILQVLAAVLACSGVYFLIARRAIAMRTFAMAACPSAYLGRTAAYVGGVYGFWGSQLRVLQSAKILPGATPGDPHILELIVGLSRAGKKAATTFDAVNLMTLRPSHTASTMQRLAVPIPRGQEAKAREIAGVLLKDCFHPDSHGVQT